nr:three component ABC system middle component [Cupriavidus taiwanensis]
MNNYRDDNLVQNSALACFLLTSFVQKYEEHTARTEQPDLFLLLLVLPILWHNRSCDAVKRRQFGTPLHTVIADQPEIKAGFQERMQAFSAVTCRGANLACASKLLKADFTAVAAPKFSSTFTRWPKGSKPVNAPAEMLSAIDRLAVWFSAESTAQLYSRFLTH